MRLLARVGANDHRRLHAARHHLDRRRLGAAIGDDVDVLFEFVTDEGVVVGRPLDLFPFDRCWLWDARGPPVDPSKTLREFGAANGERSANSEKLVRTAALFGFHAMPPWALVPEVPSRRCVVS